MPVQRLAISLPEEVATKIAAAAEATAGGNVSSWIVRAAMRELARELERNQRLASMKATLDWFEGENGQISDADLAEAERLWPEG